LRERDPAAAQRALAVMPASGSGCYDENIPFPNSWCQGLVARLRGDETAAALHSSTREKISRKLCAISPTTPRLSNTSDAKRLVEQCKPDLMLLDLRLKGGDALDLIKTLRVVHPETKMLVLSQYDELIFAERVLRAGASGYIMKENAADDVLRAIRKVLSGGLYFSERVAAAVVQRTLREKPSPPRGGVGLLSDREMQVFQLPGNGPLRTWGFPNRRCPPTQNGRSKK